MSACQTKLSWISFQRNRIVLYASKLAACADMNKYAPQAEMAQQLSCYLGRNAGYLSREEVAERRAERLSAGTREALEALKVRAEAFSTEKQVTDALAEARRTLVDRPAQALERVEQVLARSHAVPEEVHRAEVAELKARLAEEAQDPKVAALLDVASETEAVEQLQRLRTELVVPEEVVESLTSALYTSHGIRREDAIRETYQSASGLKVDTCAEFVVSRRPLFEVAGAPVFVGGRHDGIDEQKRIVEIKTRQRRFLGTPLYELVQVHAYMFMHDVRQATIVESFQGREKAHAIEFDDALWARVCDKTREFLSRHLTENY